MDKRLKHPFTKTAALAYNLWAMSRTDEANYLLDHYGHCARGSDCYWGYSVAGHFDGCLRMGWRGRACLHWRPLGAASWDELQRLIRGGVDG